MQYLMLGLFVPSTFGAFLVSHAATKLCSYAVCVVFVIYIIHRKLWIPTKNRSVDCSKQLAAQAIVEGKAKLVVGTTIFNHIVVIIIKKKVYTKVYNYIA